MLRVCSEFQGTSSRPRLARTLLGKLRDGKEKSEAHLLLSKAEGKGMLVGVGGLLYIL